MSWPCWRKIWWKHVKDRRGARGLSTQSINHSGEVVNSWHVPCYTAAAWSVQTQILFSCFSSFSSPLAPTHSYLIAQHGWTLSLIHPASHSAQRDLTPCRSRIIPRFMGVTLAITTATTAIGTSTFDPPWSKDDCSFPFTVFRTDRKVSSQMGKLK